MSIASRFLCSLALAFFVASSPVMDVALDPIGVEVSVAQAANVTATTGWNHQNNSNNLSFTATVDSGSNRNFIIYHVQKNNTDPGGTANCDMVNPTETISYNQTVSGNPDHHHYLYRWDETAIGNFDDATPTCNVDNAAGQFTLAAMYGTVENSQQSDWSGSNVFTGTDYDVSGADLAVTTTSDSGDLVVCGAVSHSMSTAIGWNNATENHESAGGDSWTAAYATRNGGTDSETITAVASTPFTGSCFSIIDLPPGPTLTGVTISAVANGFNLQGTLTGSGTLTAYGVACEPAQANPSIAQVVAGNCNDSTAALFSGSEVWTTAVQNDFDITDANSAVRYDVCLAGSDGTNDSDVVSCSEISRTVDTDQQIQELSAAISATSVFAAQSESCTATSGSPILTACGGTEWVSPGMLVDLSANFADLTDVLVVGKTSDSITVENNANATGSATVTENPYYNEAVATGDWVEGDLFTSLGLTGTHNGANNVAVLSDSTQSWMVDVHINNRVLNTTDGSQCTITDNDATTITCTLAGGTDNDWDTNDAWQIVHALTIGSNGELSYDGSEGDLEEWQYCVQNDSSTVGISFTNPACWTTDDSIYFYNVAPVLSLSDDTFLLYVSTMFTVSLDDYCTQNNGLALDYSVRSGTLPPGTALSGTRNETWSGTPTTENESLNQVEMLCRNAGELYDADNLNIYVTDDAITMPNYTGGTVAAAESAMDGVRPWLDTSQIVLLGRCDIGNSNVIDQSPAASSTIDALEDVFAGVHDDGVCLLLERRGR